MATIDENIAMWGRDYDWSQHGDEWSDSWGSAAAQWYFSLLPRIRDLVPAPRVLEIAPGYGRWTHYLRALATEQLTVVDLNERCIAACKERFAGDTHMEYHVNDGRSLAMIPDGTIDLVFSFDSLVHAESDVMQEYVQQIARKLTQEGVGVIHHSNMGELDGYRTRIAALPFFVRKFLRATGRLDTIDHQWRARTMTAAKFATVAQAAGLAVLSQELHNWHSVGLIDAISVFALRDSQRARANGPTRVFRNADFMRDAEHARRIAALAGAQTGARSAQDR